MQRLLLTLFAGLLGLASIAYGFLHGQDLKKHSDKKWYDVLKEDLALRIVFWVAGLGLLGWAGYFQFSHFA